MRLLLLCLLLGAFDAVGGELPRPANVRQNVHPVGFVRNAGQWPSEALYGVLGGGAKAALRRDGVDIFVARDALVLPGELPMFTGATGGAAAPGQRWEGRSLRFVRPSPRCRLVEGEELVTRMHFYFGDDAADWHENVGTVRSVLYRDVWDSIDVAYAFDGSHLRQSIHLRPGADPADIAFTVSGDDDAEDLFRESTAFIRTSSSLRSPPPLPMEIRVDTLRPRPGPALRSWRQLVETEFCTFFGGKADDQAFGIMADGQSNVFLSLITYSGDLPVHRAMQTGLRGGSDHYLAGLSCDGSTLLFGTYFGMRIDEFQFFNLNYHHTGFPLRRASNGDLLFWTVAMGYDFPITPGAVQSAPIDNPYTSDTRDINAVLLRFRDDGRLRASSYLEGPTYSRITDIAVGPDDDVYVLGLATGEQWFVTPGVVHPSLSMPGHGPCQACLSTAYVARLSPELDTLRWGTYFFNANGNNNIWIFPLPDDAPIGSIHMVEMDMEIDSRGCPVIVGTADTLSRLTATRPYGTPAFDATEAWLVRLTPDARSYRHAVSLHSAGSIAAWAMVLDADDNAIVHGITSANGFPATAPPLMGSATATVQEAYLAKFDSSGALLGAALVGGSSGSVNGAGDVALSRCGEIVILSPTGFDTKVQTVDARDMPRALEVLGRGFPVTSITVCDSALTGVTYRSPKHSDSNDDYNYHAYGYGWLGPADIAVLDPAGYVYSINNNRRIAEQDPILYNTSRTTQTETDIYFSRHHYPICQLLSCRLEVEDTLIVPNPPEDLVPSEFAITVTIDAEAASGEAVNVIGDLFLPDGVNTLAGDSVVHIVFEPDTMAPGTSISRTVMVRPTRAFRTDTLPYVFIGYYTDSRDDRSCPRPLTVCNAHTRLRRVAEYRPLPECELVVHDSLIDYPASPPCAPGTVPVQLTLRHRGLAPWDIGTVVLRLADGMGLGFAPPGDSLRGAMRLEPGDTLSWTWLLTLPLRDAATLARVRVHVYDETGREIATCWDEVPLPEMPGQSCALSHAQTITWDVAAGTALTDPIPVSVLVDNRRDSTLGMTTARIDLSRARHLRLDAGETVEKALGTLGRCQQVNAHWRLRLTEPAQTYSTDTVTVWYRFDGDPTERACTGRIQIFRLEKSVSCVLSIPDTLGTLPGDASRHDTLRVMAVIANTGSATVGLKDALLTTVGADGLLAIDPLQQPLAALPAGDTVRLSWRLRVPVSSFAREIRCDLLVTDARNAPVTQCAAAVTVPPIALPLQCTVTMPDSIRVIDGGYHPAPIPLRVTVHNPSDTLASDLTATLLLDSAPGLRPRAGEATTRSVPSVPQRDSVQLVWTLEAVQAPGADTTQRAEVLIQRGGRLLTTCAASTLLEGMPRFARLSCLASGHDSAYSDPRYERIVPDPLQVWYSILNSGTVEASSCAVTLLLPPDWRLADGVANPADFGTIAPGDTVTRSWLITPEEGAPWTDHLSIAFTGGCGTDTIAGGCTHQIGLSSTITRDVVFTPLRLQFEAERNGPLPAAQTAQVWTAGAAPIEWSATPSLPWLDALPAMTQGPGSIVVRPNSTDLSVASHTAVIHIGSGQPSSRGITVFYRITDGTSSTPPVAVSLDGMHAYPNPYSPGSHGMLHIRLSDALRDAAEPLHCSIHDLLGRELHHVVVGKEDTRNGVLSLRFASSPMQAGPVLLTVRGARHRATMLLMLAP